MLQQSPGPGLFPQSGSLSQVHLVAGDPEILSAHQLQLLDLRLAKATAVLSLEVRMRFASDAEHLTSQEKLLDLRLANATAVLSLEVRIQHDFFGSKS